MFICFQFSLIPKKNLKWCIVLNVYLSPLECTKNNSHCSLAETSNSGPQNLKILQVHPISVTFYRYTKIPSSTRASLGFLMILKTRHLSSSMIFKFLEKRNLLLFFIHPKGLTHNRCLTNVG